MWSACHYPHLLENRSLSTIHARDVWLCILWEMCSRSPYWWDPKNAHPWFWQLCCIEGSSEHYSIASGLYNESGITSGSYSFLLVCNLRLNSAVVYWWPLQSYIRVNTTCSILSLTECCHYLWFGKPPYFGMSSYTSAVIPLQHTQCYTVSSRW